MTTLDDVMGDIAILDEKLEAITLSGKELHFQAKQNRSHHARLVHQLAALKHDFLKQKKQHEALQQHYVDNLHSVGGTIKTLVDSQIKSHDRIDDTNKSISSVRARAGEVLLSLQNKINKLASRVSDLEKTLPRPFTSYPDAKKKRPRRPIIDESSSSASVGTPGLPISSSSASSGSSGPPISSSSASSGSLKRRRKGPVLMSDDSSSSFVPFGN